MIFIQPEITFTQLLGSTHSFAISELTVKEAETLHFISQLSEDYPDIQNWYIKKVVPGHRSGTRLLLPFYRNEQLAAVGIAKNDGSEKKICTVRVAPQYYGKGLGLKVFDGLLKWLNEDRPSLTVSENKINSFERIFEWYGFKFTGSEKDVYVQGREELGFNDAILPKPSNRQNLKNTNIIDYSA